MANTIRRTPVSFDIPDSPDYKFLNITDFRGIAISDNPFTLSSNTASDMLNLYVDETNTLTTRPRLELYESIKKSHPDMTKFLGLYPLSFGFLLHYIKTDGSYAISLISSSNGTLNYYDVTNGETIEGEKLIVFEQNDNIYILNGSNYYVITYTLENNVLSNISCSIVEGYVPTTKVGGTNLTEGRDYEPYNLLSNKYKRTYIWDGSWSLNDIIVDVNDNIDVSEAIESFHVVQEDFDYYPVKYIPSDDEVNGKYFWEKEKIFVQNNPTYHQSSTKIGWLSLIKDDNNVTVQSFTSIDFPETVTSDYEGAILRMAMTPTGSRKAFLLSTGLYDSSKGILIGESPAGEYVTISTEVKASSSSDNLLSISDDGLTIAAVTKQADYSTSGSSVIVAYWDDETTDWMKQEWDFENYGILGIKLSGDGKSLMIEMYDSNHTNIYRYFAGLNSSSKVEPFVLDDVDVITQSFPGSNSFSSSDLSFDGSILACPHGAFFNISSGDFTFTRYSEINNFHSSGIARFSTDGTKIYVLNCYDNYNTGWYDLETKKIFITPLIINSDFMLRSGIIHASDSKIIAIDNYNGLLLDSFYFNYSSEVPNITVTHTLTSDDEIYSSLIERKNLFLQSTLSTRFDNQRWFAAKNTVFRTSNNDPAYIPITNYSNLGETDENITGFNLVQDSLMVVYKDNYIWAVSPMTYTDNDVTYYDYNYQETKNTVGNNAIGASIVSAYRELPLQIAYDGIYALSQLTNVYASDRISESISDNITKKWLQEDRSVIQNAKTINRLYWTYVILSYENITKVYLLDNRTTSWFYWELPISVVNAFVKDNVVYMTHTDGTVYTLQTAEIINKYNPNLTEYYDDGEQIINWYWKSQILPLGTINYSKRLIDTTFIFTDTDSTDEYSLDYKFTAYRKVVSQTNATTISNQLNYIQSTTKKTLINRCNFIQLELSNSVDDLNNNKLRLVGLGFKYVLLEGLL